MNVHVISVAYGLPGDLRAMWDAVQSKHDLTWHLFLHSKIGAVMEVCGELAHRPQVIYHPYGKNRGLSKSINEGLLAAFGAGADVVVNIADDMLPSAGDFDRLVEFALDQKKEPIVTASAYHIRDKTVGPCEISFTAWNKGYSRKVGMLDENLFPAYYEDTDYIHRVRLAGGTLPVLEDTDILHKSSGNIYAHPALMQQNHTTFERNRAYYIRKWGGDRGSERYDVPFDDEQFNLKIKAADRHAPYSGHNRDDQDIVKV